MDEFLELVEDLSAKPGFECLSRRCGGIIKYKGQVIWDSEDDMAEEGELYRKVMRRIETILNK